MTLVLNRPTWTDQSTPQDDRSVRMSTDAGEALQTSIGTPARSASQVVVLQQGTSIPGASQIKLHHALSVEVVNNEDGFVVSAGALHEEAYGRTFPEAYFEFLTSLLDRRESLASREAPLSSEDQVALDYLRALLTDDA